MKDTILGLMLALLVSLSGQAQTFTDDFNDNTVDSSKWAGEELFGNARIREQNQRLDYTVATSTDGDFGGRSWVGQLPMNTHWEATVQVHNAFTPAPEATRYQWSSVGIQLQKPGSIREAAYIELFAESSASASPFRGFLASIETDDVIFGDETVEIPGQTDALLKLSYNAATRVLTASYDVDGVGVDYGWQPMASFGLGGSGGGLTNRNWNLSPAQNFTLKIGGYSEDSVIAAGQMWLDNFTLTLLTNPPPQMVVTTDDFNDNVKNPAKWGSDTNYGGGLLGEQNQRLDYFVPAPGDDGDKGMRPWIGDLPVDADWEAVLQVHNSAAAGPDDYLSVGLELTRPGDLIEGIFIEHIAESVDGALNRGFLTSFETDDAVFGDRYADFIGVTDASVRISYQAAGQIVTTSYDRDGAGNVFGWEPMGSFGLNGAGGGLASRPWNLSGTNRFVLYVIGYSEAPAVAPGQLWMDNFSLSVAQTQGPPMTIERLGTNLRLTWPGAATGYTLQTKSAVGSPTWASITTPSTAPSGVFEAIIPLPAQNTFFRLAK